MIRNTLIHNVLQVIYRDEFELYSNTPSWGQEEKKAYKPLGLQHCESDSAKCTHRHVSHVPVVVTRLQGATTRAQITLAGLIP